MEAHQQTVSKREFNCKYHAILYDYVLTQPSATNLESKILGSASQEKR